MDKYKDIDWFFWLDSDTMIIDDEIDARIFPYLVTNDKSFILCSVYHDELAQKTADMSCIHWNVNTGAFFVRNNNLGRIVIDVLISSYFSYGKSLGDQEVIQEVLRKNDTILNKLTALYPSSVFNHWGKFICHACRHHEPEYKINRLKEALERKEYLYPIDYLLGK